MTLAWPRIYLYYLAIGLVLVGVTARSWLAAYERESAKWTFGPALRLIAFTCGVLWDVAFWPLYLWRILRAAAFAAATRRFNEDFHAAVVRARNCPHTDVLKVWPAPDPSQPPLAFGPMPKCRQCWAILVDGVWTPNIVPPPQDKP